MSQMIWYVFTWRFTKKYLMYDLFLTGAEIDFKFPKLSFYSILLFLEIQQSPIPWSFLLKRCWYWRKCLWISSAWDRHFDRKFNYQYSCHFQRAINWFEKTISELQQTKIYRFEKHEQLGGDWLDCKFFFKS